MAVTARSNFLSATEREAALGRIGCAGLEGRQSAWNIVNWFVRLARNKKPFAEMSTLELELLRQEYRALQEVPWQRTGSFTEDVIKTEALEKFRSEIRTRLEELVDYGSTAFGPFTLKRNVFLAKDGDNLTDTQIYGRDLVDPFKGHGLLYQLSRLLTEVGLAMRRCPHCSEIFLRARADANYCSRSCQANAYARRQREAGKTKKPGTKVTASRPNVRDVPRKRAKAYRNF